MHMADALISPIIGGTFAAVSLFLLTKASKKIKNNVDTSKLPLMGVLGAFVFAAQMINFTIPGTGSSGHLGGGLLLAALLGPQAALLTMAVILTLQALVFADGGLIALGCNIFNMGVVSCLFAYPLIFKPLVQKHLSSSRIMFASILAAVIGLQLGAFGVVLETFLSGVTELPFRTFVLLMQPIHLAIGLVEGIVTGLVLNFVFNTEPALLALTTTSEKNFLPRLRKIIFAFFVLALITAGGFSIFASENPDGLEWSIAGVTGSEELETTNPTHSYWAELQTKTAFLPDYNLQNHSSSAGTAFAGLVGTVLTCGLVFSGFKLIIHK